MDRRNNIDRARDLRKASSDAELKLWQSLRSRQLRGFKFRRQVSMGPYIVDFACLESGLIVEVDGGQHAERQSYDRARTRWLEAQGYRVLRYWNHEVLTGLDSVLESILRALPEAGPHPNPLPQAGEGE